MPLEFDSSRLETVRFFRNGDDGIVRFSTHVLYFETLTRLREIIEARSNARDVAALYFETEGKNFLLGADVDYFYEAVVAGRQDRIMTYSDLGNDLFDAVEALPFPTAARIDGAALGGGFELALACSARVATSASSFAFPETGLGIFPGWGGIKRLRRRIGPSLAKWAVYTGKSIPAPLALRLGIIDSLVPANELSVASKRLTDEIRQQGRRPTLTDIPDVQRNMDSFFRAPLSDIFSRSPADQDEKRLYDQLKRQAPVSLQFAERIFDHADLLPPPMERRFEDTLTWRIYHTPDAESGLGHVHAGKMGKPHFSGELR